MPTHTTTDEPTHDCYRVEFATRAYTNPHIDSLNISAHEPTAVVRFTDDVDDVMAVLSDVFVPTERDGVTVTCATGAVDVLETSPTVVQVLLTVET